MNWIKKNISNICIFLILILGLSLLIYPSLSDYVNSMNQSKVISSYKDNVEEIDQSEYLKIIEEARKYNQTITVQHQDWKLDEEELIQYNSLLNISNTGIMGYIEIPKIRVQLSIYHGVSDAVLQTGVGHIEGSSLPVGGIGTHSVISGHRGLPSAKLFTNLDQLVEGDVFMLRILDEVLTYQVDQISIVEPDNISLLKVEEDKDYVTLVTCTPYGVNTHRLLVRGHRIENIKDDSIFITSEALQVDPILIAPLLSIPFFIIIFSFAFFKSKYKKHIQSMRE